MFLGAFHLTVLQLYYVDVNAQSVTATIYCQTPLVEKKPLLRHIASDYLLGGHKIYPKYREPFNVFVEGNKKCLEIKEKIPKSSKHFIWGVPSLDGIKGNRHS